MCVAILRSIVGLIAGRRGSVAIIFSLSAVPLIAIIGIGIDYGYMLSVKAKLDQAADAAAVAGAVTTQAYLVSNTGSSDVTSLAKSAGQAQASAQFVANVGKLPAGTLSQIVPDIVRDKQTITSTLHYSFVMKPFLMGIVGVNQMQVAGSSVSSVIMPTYVNVYIVIDNSESMGIGATLDDQQKVYGATGGCALACHYYSHDTVDAAHNAGAQLRLDVAKRAIVTGLNTIPTGSNYKVAIYTMSTTLESVYKLSNNITGAIAAAGSVGLEDGSNSGGTNTTSALKTLTKQLPRAGDGLTQPTAKGIVILITDAVQDSATKVRNGSSLNDSTDPNFVKYSPCNIQSCWESPDFAMTIQEFDATPCRAIRDLNYTMITLDVQYLIPPANMQSNDAFTRVFSYVSQYLKPSMVPNMAKCASSPASAYSANTPSDIAAAMNNIFSSIQTAAVARLTQ